MPRKKNEHGQYFTPRPIADLMARMLHSKKSQSILEPSAGEGVFLDALTDSGYTTTTGVEIDPSLVKASKHQLITGSFVSWIPPAPFDAVIGNPPYIRWKDLSVASKAEVMSHPLFNSLFNSLSDYLTVFIALSVEALRPGGELIFITPSFWMNTTHSASLREWLLERGAITDIVDFGEASVFQGVSSSIIIFRFEKGKAASKSPTKRRDITLSVYTGPRSLPGGPLLLNDQAIFEKKSIPAFEPNTHWTLASQEELAPTLALEDACSHSGEISRLGDFVDIANGMVSGLDAVFKLPLALAPVLTKREQEPVVQVLKAFQTEPFTSTNTTSYIRIPQGLDEDAVKKHYPNLLAHLRPHKEALEKRYSTKGAIPFWEWSFPRSAAFFATPAQKGFVPSKERLTNKSCARFTLAPTGIIATQDVTAFVPLASVKENIAYIVAYLSHPSVTSWIRHRGMMKGGVAEFSERPLANIPFRAINWSDPSEVAIHDRIVALMTSHASAQAATKPAVESQITTEIDTLLAI